MELEDLYEEQGLMTSEELENWHHDPSQDRIPTLTPAMRRLVFGEDGFKAKPEARSRREFERRPPALGVTSELLQEIREQKTKLTPVQQRQLFGVLRGTMLEQLIPCPGASTVEELLDILQSEIDSGIPAPVPKWYKFSTTTMGRRKIGYDACYNRGCYQTETIENWMPFCTECRLAFYCCKACQVEDWKIRHKKVCKMAIKRRETLDQVGKMMQGLSDLSLTNQMGWAAKQGLTYGDLAKHAKKNPEVKKRRKQLRAEKKRQLGEKPKGPDPNFF